jgi:excisionase family DNA binding protein
VLRPGAARDARTAAVRDILHELAQHLNIGDHVIYVWIRQGKLHAHRTGRRRLAIPFNDTIETACRQRLADSPGKGAEPPFQLIGDLLGQCITLAPIQIGEPQVVRLDDLVRVDDAVESAHDQPRQPARFGVCMPAREEL